MHVSLFRVTSRRGPALVCMAALAGLASGCGAGNQGPTAACTSVAPLSVVVTVRDSVSGAAAADGAVGTLVGSGVDDTLSHADSLTLLGGDQLGTFTVTIDRPGFLTWTAADVQVTQRGSCGNVIPVRLTAKLEPATS